MALPPLILASASPRRRDLLTSLGVPFEIVTASVEEEEDPATDPRVMVAHNAALKADWVAAHRPEALVLGADTTVFLDGTTLNKPRDPADARRMLRRLAGRTHTVFTGLALRQVSTGLKLDEEVATQVTFHPLDDATIEAYLAQVHTLDKAGGYAIQEHGELIVAGYAGSFTNIVGFPVETVKQLLTRGGLLA
jgi:septum formation protein